MVTCKKILKIQNGNQNYLTYVLTLLIFLDVTTMTLDNILVHLKGNDTAKKILSSDSTDDPANTDTGK